jgi:hypothetical protein
MELSGKALTFVIAAVRHHIEWHDAQLARTDLSEDARSDLTNDKYYLAALLADMSSKAEARPAGRPATEPGHG